MSNRVADLVALIGYEQRTPLSPGHRPAGKADARHARLTSREVDQMRAVPARCTNLGDGLEHIQPGITTNAIDRLVDTFIRDHGAYPSPLNYRGFPKNVYVDQ